MASALLPSDTPLDAVFAVNVSPADIVPLIVMFTPPTVIVLPGV